MKNVCLYFQIHHPFWFQTFRFFDIGESKSYYDEWRIEREMRDAAANYYLPSNEFLLKLIHQYKGNLKVSFNISGSALDQFLIYTPLLFNSFRQLADTGQVEFTGSTNSNSIISLTDNKNKFIQSINRNKERIDYYFGQKPKVFINTDLLYNNQIAQAVAEAGYLAILTNGTKKILQWRSPNYLYCGEDQKQVSVLFRNEKISNELSSLLARTNQLEIRKQFEQLFAVLDTIPIDEEIINIYFNYKLLGGIHRLEKQRLFRTFVSKIIKKENYRFKLPSQIIEQYGPVSAIGTEEPICWVEHFHSDYYPGNELQKDAINQLFKLCNKVEKTDDNNLMIDWKNLQSSDHFNLMDENHPDYYENPTQNVYKSKYDAFINYMNILEDFRLRLKSKKVKPESVHIYQKFVQPSAKHQ